MFKRKQKKIDQKKMARDWFLLNRSLHGNVYGL